MRKASVSAVVAVAGVGAVLGIVGLFIGGDDEPVPPADTTAITVRPMVGPTLFGLQGTW